MMRISGEKLAYWIAERGLSQAELGKKAAVNEDTITRIIKTGKTGKQCRSITARQLAKALDVDLKNLLPDEEGAARMRNHSAAPMLSESSQECADLTSAPSKGQRDLGSLPSRSPLIENVVVVPYRKEVLGVLPSSGRHTAYEMLRNASQIDMLGLNLYVSWFADTEFVAAIQRRRPKSAVRILLPRRESHQLAWHGRSQKELLKATDFFEHYDKTISQLKQLSLIDSLRFVDEIVVHAGIVRLGAVAIVTPYLAFRRGSNSPAVLVEREVAPRTFEAFCGDFDAMWRLASKQR